MKFLYIAIAAWALATVRIAMYLRRRRGRGRDGFGRGIVASRNQFWRSQLLRPLEASVGKL